MWQGLTNAVAEISAAHELQGAGVFEVDPLLRFAPQVFAGRDQASIGFAPSLAEDLVLELGLFFVEQLNLRCDFLRVVFFASSCLKQVC
jgi:hypothetical protein